MSATTTWQLSMGPSEQSSIVNFLQTYDLPHPFDYPKGKAKMTETPQIGDRVVITCKAKEIATGTIAIGFHTRAGIEVATVMVEEIVHTQPHRRGQQRNWTKILC